MKSARRKLMTLAGVIVMTLLSGCSTLPLWVDEIIVDVYEAE